MAEDEGKAMRAKGLATKAAIVGAVAAASVMVLPGLASADVIEGPRPAEATATAVENGVKIKVTKGEVEDQGYCTPIVHTQAVADELNNDPVGPISFVPENWHRIDPTWPVWDDEHGNNRVYVYPGESFETTINLADGKYVLGVYCYMNYPPEGMRSDWVTQIPFVVGEEGTPPVGGFGSIQFPAFGS
ncbi:hypothetical protein R4P70_11355 [Rhodococcus sp. IEGM 1241]|uniref:hypothetical protein n=1 Tax=Rhodococcus sp. IEGM 1241 TaxID=3082228 RepID=UPI002955800F|nr:hypothetical protein [Rhodococcus sp. IEGM 1241]MDV8011895.1 hypothetical protein [Rhodococcus sp. IEGM 1241]